uniref:Transcription factor HES-5 n=1 Tax=Kryptolebias marmoratus TaxID=37003 RepID=A0A3Q3B617_KRYMA
MKPAEIRCFPKNPRAMSPITSAAMTNPQELLTMDHKLRKPLVEKLRRERINSSIEQLKSLLGPEFLKQQPDSKLEKADILEMTVCFLSCSSRTTSRDDCWTTSTSCRRPLNRTRETLTSLL